MKYSDIYKGTFISRPNRFIAKVQVDGDVVTAHVRNTGRCRELLKEGATVYLTYHDNSTRKTSWSLVGVEKEERIVNIDSQIPNKLVHEWLKKGNLFKNIIKIKPEFSYGNSRLDFYVETDTDKVLIEVKGVTLEENNVAMFPDAPTQRGIKHIFELCKGVDEGYNAYIIFIVQMEGVKYFTPNVKMHKEFSEALNYAKEKNVEIIAMDCIVTNDSIAIKDDVDVVL